jgi:hypothetical protein
MLGLIAALLSTAPNGLPQTPPTITPAQTIGVFVPDRTDPPKGTIVGGTR